MPDPRLSIVLVAALALPSSAALAQLDAPAPPDDPASAMFTLTDIYQRLAAGVPGATSAMPTRPMDPPFRGRWRPWANGA